MLMRFPFVFALTALLFGSLYAQTFNDPNSSPFGNTNGAERKLPARSTTVLVGKGMRFDAERQRVLQVVWEELKKSYTLSMDADIVIGSSGLPLVDNMECLDAYYRYIAANPLTKVITVTEKCPECKGSKVKIIYSDDPRFRLSYKTVDCPACAATGTQDVVVTYSILCDSAKIPAKGETPRMRAVKDLLAKSNAGDLSARLQYAGYLLRGDEGVVRDVEMSKSLYRGMLVAGRIEAIDGLLASMEASVGKTADDRKFMRILQDTSRKMRSASSPSQPIKADESTSASKSKEASQGATVVASKPAFIDETIQSMLVEEFSSLFKAHLLSEAQLSYGGFTGYLASRSRTAGDIKSIIFNWVVSGKRDHVDLAMLKDLKVNGVNLEPRSLAFLAGIVEEGLASSPNPLAAYVLFKMAYIQTGRVEYLEQVKRLEGAINKDLAQQVLFEFENLRRSKSPLNTYIDSVLSLK
jgi:hypothetical protein